VVQIWDAYVMVEEQPPEMAEPALAFRPQVGRARPRLRLGFVVALLLTLAAGVVTLLVRRDGRSVEPVVVQAPAQNLSGCTALTVATTIKDPQMTESQRAVCLAVAGSLEEAQRRLRVMSPAERMQAVSDIFTVAHPIADSGDDRSAGPIMELVVQWWPQNYMAVFHAGMAEFALGQDEQARAQLTRFLAMYSAQDVWRQRAEKALADIARQAPLDQREAHFAE
jgi:hypothetical protein